MEEVIASWVMSILESSTELVVLMPRAQGRLVSDCDTIVAAKAVGVARSPMPSSDEGFSCRHKNKTCSSAT